MTKKELKDLELLIGSDLFDLANISERLEKSFRKLLVEKEKYTEQELKEQEIHSQMKEGDY